MSDIDVPNAKTKKYPRKGAPDSLSIADLEEATLEQLSELSPAVAELVEDVALTDAFMIEKYGRTKLARARARCDRGGIREVLSTRWQVPGHPDLGDAWNSYDVYYEDFPSYRAGYYCLCNRSRTKVCTHTLAVWVYNARQAFRAELSRLLDGTA